jgi:hypothetical protein
MGSSVQEEQLRAFLRRTTRLDGAIHLELQSLHGGLEAAAVYLVRARAGTAPERPREISFVAKQLDRNRLRELSVYRALVARHAQHLAPRLLGVEKLGTSAGCVLYLEAMSGEAWPWRDLRAVQRVMGGLAELHRLVPSQAALTALRRWDYESELGRAAGYTLELLERCRGTGLAFLARRLPVVRRLVLSLPALRRQLQTALSLQPRVLHGDVHPGNVLLRRRRDGGAPVFIDWGRARLGSPLEDVSSWLQSLGYWEPEARRRHDTLLVGYLAASGLPTRLSAELRTAYWLAGASNGLAGALAHHLAAAQMPGAGDDARAGAVAAAAAWLRVMRRADAHAG